MRRATKITGTNRDPADCNILVTPIHEAKRRDNELKQEQHDSLFGEDRAKVALKGTKCQES